MSMLVLPAIIVAPLIVLAGHRLNRIPIKHLSGEGRIPRRRRILLFGG
ncbi:MAG: hypothetical protein KGL43_02240 [Burkholderiales bacterium]|nr:hypothetical protein [Burkholderiales bacterium]